MRLNTCGRIYVEYDIYKNIDESSTEHLNHEMISYEGTLYLASIRQQTTLIGQDLPDDR